MMSIILPLKVTGIYGANSMSPNLVQQKTQLLLA